MVSLIPYRKATLTTHLSTVELKHGIGSNFADPRLYKTYGWLGKLPKEPFVGVIESNTFRLRNVSNRVTARRFGPVYQGQFIDNLDHRQVIVSVWPGWLELLTYGFGIMFVLAVMLSDAQTMTYTLVFLGFIYVFVMFDFNIRSYNTLRLLKVMIQSQQE